MSTKTAIITKAIADAIIVVNVAIKHSLKIMGGEVLVDNPRSIPVRPAVVGVNAEPIVNNNIYNKSNNKNNKAKANKIIKTYAHVSKYIGLSVKPSTIKFQYNAIANPNAVNKYMAKTTTQLNSTVIAREPPLPEPPRPQESDDLDQFGEDIWAELATEFSAE